MLAFLGGTGPEGRGLALRLALAGEAAIIGSRDAGRAAAAGGIMCFRTISRRSPCPCWPIA